MAFEQVFTGGTSPHPTYKSSLTDADEPGVLAVNCTFCPAATGTDSHRLTKEPSPSHVEAEDAHRGRPLLKTSETPGAGFTIKAEEQLSPGQAEPGAQVTMNPKTKATAVAHAPAGRNAGRHLSRTGVFASAELPGNPGVRFGDKKGIMIIFRSAGYGRGAYWALAMSFAFV